MTSISIDKIVVVSEVETRELQHLISNSWNVRRNYIIKNYFYNRAIEFTDGSNLRLGKYYKARLEFNPNKCSRDIVKEILALFEDIHVSRLDIAIDYKDDLSKYVWFEKSGKRNIRSFRQNNGKLSTVYFGKRRSPLTFVIYNKGLKDQTDLDLWRVELRIKNPFMGNIMPVDVFDDICGGGVSKFPYRDSHFARLRNQPEYIKQLSKERRKSARKLSMDSDDRLYRQPSEVFQDRRGYLFKSIERYIIIPASEGNYSIIDYDSSTNDEYSLDIYLSEW